MVKGKYAIIILVSFIVICSVSGNTFGEDWNYSGSDNPIYTINSPVGVGTSTPRAGLEVLNGLVTDGLLMESTNGDYISSGYWWSYMGYPNLYLNITNSITGAYYGWQFLLDAPQNNSKKLVFASHIDSGEGSIDDGLLVLKPKENSGDIGKVGIGTSDPTEKLDVNGNVKVAGDIDISGKINTNCDENGTICIGNCGCQ